MSEMVCVIQCLYAAKKGDKIQLLVCVTSAQRGGIQCMSKTF